MSGSKQNGENDRPDQRLPTNWVRGYALVFEFLAYLGVLGYIGWQLDARKETQPWGLLGGLLLGMILGLIRMVREAKKMGF